MIRDAHPNWKSYREFDRLVALLDAELGTDTWEFVSLHLGEDICTTRPLPTGRTGGVLVRVVNRNRPHSTKFEDSHYLGLDYWDLTA